MPALPVSTTIQIWTAWPLPDNVWQQNQNCRLLFSKNRFVCHCFQLIVDRKFTWNLACFLMVPMYKLAGPGVSEAPFGSFDYTIFVHTCNTDWCNQQVRSSTWCVAVPVCSRMGKYRYCVITNYQTSGNEIAEILSSEGQGHRRQLSQRARQVSAIGRRHILRAVCGMPLVNSRADE